MTTPSPAQKLTTQANDYTLVQEDSEEDHVHKASVVSEDGV
jgi:hypothetical protein